MKSWPFVSGVLAGGVGTLRKDYAIVIAAGDTALPPRQSNFLSLARSNGFAISCPIAAKGNIPWLFSTSFLDFLSLGVFVREWILLFLTQELLRKKKFHGKRSGKWPGRVFLPPCFSLSEVSWCFLMARVPSSPHTRSQSIFQKPLAVWSPCREPAPREFPARQRHHLPFLSACFKCHLPCLLMSQQVGMSIAWLMEDAKGRLSPGQHGILWAALDQESGDEWVALTMN